jgi:hypothetical protein
MNMAVFWDVVPCSLIDIDLMIEAVSFSETSVFIYQTTRCNIPQDSHLHTRHRKNLKISRCKITLILLYEEFYSYVSAVLEPSVSV